VSRWPPTRPTQVLVGPLWGRESCLPDGHNTQSCVAPGLSLILRCVFSLSGVKHGIPFDQSIDRDPKCPRDHITWPVMVRVSPLCGWGPSTWKWSMDGEITRFPSIKVSIGPQSVLWTTSPGLLWSEWVRSAAEGPSTWRWSMGDLDWPMVICYAYTWNCELKSSSTLCTGIIVRWATLSMAGWPWVMCMPAHHPETFDLVEDVSPPTILYQYMGDYTVISGVQMLKLCPSGSSMTKIFGRQCRWGQCHHICCNCSSRPVMLCITGLE
jgi:hypothetical protein